MIDPNTDLNSSSCAIEAYAIEVVDLKKTFDEKIYVINGMNLSIPKGSLTFVIGYSGTGKSVLIKNVVGIFKPTSGEIKVLGQNILDLDKDELTKFRQKFGVLFQFAALFDDMTVFENVCFPLSEHKNDLSKNQIEEIAKKKLKMVGLDPKHFHKAPSQISGGMQKRTGLARALALDPEIIFYDEPTTGLDPILTEMVDNLILNTHKANKGMTSVVISHDLAAAFKIADHIAMLDSGKCVLFGKPEEFLKTEIDLVKKFIAKGMKSGK
jgi:phospholipid/cholesterol/gamma-HCH transport system ATP-binding protein